MPDWATALLGMMGVGLAGSLWWSATQSRARSRADAQLEDAAASSRHLEKTLREVESERAELASQCEDLRLALDESDRRLKGMDDSLAAAQRAVAERALTLQDLEGELHEARALLREREEQLREREAQTRDKNRAFADLRARDRRNTELLRALGAVVNEVNPEPFAGEMRALTRQGIQQLLVDSGSRATALANSEALLGASAGSDAGAERLAQAAGLVAEIEAEIEGVLCAPLAGWSVMDRRFCSHLIRLDETWWLGVENMGTAPLFAMRQCALKLVGLRTPQRNLHAPSTAIQLDEAPDRKLSEKISRWAGRWGAQSVTVLDVEGRPFGATPSAQPSTVMALGRKLTPLLMRMERDARDLADLSLVARASDNTTVMLRVVGQDLESPLLAVLARTEIPEEALDELCGLIRWHAPSAPSLAAV